MLFLHIVDGITQVFTNHAKWQREIANLKGHKMRKDLNNKLISYHYVWCPISYQGIP